MAERSTQRIQIPGVEIFEELGRGTQCIVYRAVKDGQNYALKINRSESHANALNFRREAAILARLKHPALPRVYEVGESQDTTYEIMEWVRGRALNAYSESGKVDEESLLRLGRTVAGALEEIHAQGLVHRDIKPQNIIAGEGLSGAKLIDFGFAANASTFEKEGEVTVGTFLYSAPEQIGALQRPVDARSDLYALGGVFFELATGKPPFNARDVGELVRLHAVHNPPPVDQANPGISPAMARIVTKLLAKDPDDRYQSARGLIKDMEQLATLNAAIARGESPELDTALQDGRATGELPLAGRSTELDLLGAAWNQVHKGRSSIVLLQGQSGSGKSRLVRELLYRVVPKGERLNANGTAKLLLGKCTLEQGISFAPIREAIEAHLHQIAQLPESSKQTALASVRSAAGDFGSMLRHFSPSLSSILSSDVDPNTRDDSQELFYGAVARFVLRLGSGDAPHSPLILFFDDVQWLDESSKKVMATLCAQIRNYPVLVICTVRNHEENKDAVAAFREDVLAHVDSSVQIREINVAPLGKDDVAELISSHLGGFKAEEEFIEQMLRRTDGSPFAVGEYLRAMLEAGLLTPYWGTWKIQREKLETLSLPKDVIQLVLTRVETLSERARNALSIAAVLGTSFKEELLASVAGLGGELGAVLAEAQQAKLIEQNEHGGYTFIHDRVQEAFLARLVDGNKRQIHQRIAETLERVSGPTKSVEDRLTLARHYVQGERDRNPDKLYRACIDAAKAALDNFINGDAYDLLREANTVSTTFGVNHDENYDELAAIAAQRTLLYDEAIESFKDAIAKCDDLHKRAHLRSRLMKLYTVNLQNAKAYEQMSRAFIEMDVAIPRLRISYAIISLWDWVVSLLIRGTGIGAGTVPAHKRQDYQTLARLYEVSIMVTFYNLHRTLNVFMIGRALRVVARLGPCPEMAVVYSHYASVPGILGLDSNSKSWSEKSIHIAERSGEPTVLANTIGQRGTSNLMLGNELEGEKYLKHALDKYGNWLATEEYFSMSGSLSWTFGNRGYVRERLELVDFETERLASMGGQSDFLKAHFLSWIYSAKMTLLVIQGRVAEGLEAKGKLEALNLTNIFDRLHAYGDTIAFFTEQGELGAPVEAAIQRFDDLSEAIMDMYIPVFLHQSWMYRCHARLAQAEAAEGDKREAAIRRFKDSLREFEKIIETPIFRGHAYVLRAALKQLKGKDKASLRDLIKAERIGGEEAAPWILFLVHCRRAMAFKKLGNEHMAAAEAQIAFDMAMRHDWKIRANTVARDYAGVVTERSASHSSATFSSVNFSGSFTGPSPSNSTLAGTQARKSNLRLQQHLSSLLQVSLSSATVLNPDLQARTVLDEIVRVLKAERAFLLVCKELDPNGELEHRAGRDALGKDLAQLQGYSGTVVKQVRAAGKPVIVSGTEKGAVTGTESVIAHGLRSIMAAPVKVRGEVVGVVYLDNRLAKGIFTKEDVEILEALAAHIAVSLEVARTLRLEMERQSLHDSLGRLRSLLANVPVVLFELDGDGVCRLAAGKSFDSIGVMPQEAPGASFVEVFKGHAAMNTCLSRALKGETFSSTVELNDKIFEMFFQPLKDSSGNLASVIAVAIDTTEQKRAESMLINSSKLSALGEMAGGVAHEINNPLAIINMMTAQLGEILVEDGAAPPPPLALDLLKKIQTTVERIARIVKGLRSFAREAVHDPTKSEPIKTIIEDTLALCTEKFKAHGVELLVDPPQDEVSVPCISTQISQVVLNLLNNAYDATTHIPKRWVRLSWSQDDDHVRISVTDCGAGIPPHVRHKVFQPFFTTKAIGAGTGLGLSISKGLIENHGGKLEYDEKCANTRFVISLPRKSKLAAAKSSPQAVA